MSHSLPEEMLKMFLNQALLQRTTCPSAGESYFTNQAYTLFSTKFKRVSKELMRGPVQTSSQLYPLPMVLHIT